MHPNLLQPPCLGIQAFLQPSEDPNWHEHPDTLRAQVLCNSECPREHFEACALAGLSAGTCEDDLTPRVADGVVMAGVVCRGDIASEHSLRRALRGRAVGWRAKRPSRCLGCDRPMTTRRRKLPGHVVHEAAGHCTACRRAQKRSA